MNAPLTSIPDPTDASSAGSSDLDPRAMHWAYISLAPFVLGALLAMIVRDHALPFVLHMLAGYGAAVIAFLGGVHWTFAMQGRQPVGASTLRHAMIPVVLAWLAVVMPPHAGLVVQGVAMIGGYLVDRKVYPRQGLSPWLVIRFRASMGAALCCFLAAAQT